LGHGAAVALSLLAAGILSAQIVINGPTSTTTVAPSLLS